MQKKAQSFIKDSSHRRWGSRMLLVALFCLTTIAVPISQCMGSEKYKDPLPITLLATAQAPWNPAAEQRSLACRERASLLQIGGNYTHATIKPSTTAAFNGNLGGLQGIYEYCPLHSFYGAVKMLWRQGNTTNDVGKRFLFDIDVQERLGYTLASNCERYVATFFTGFGYRYLAHKLHQYHHVFKLNYNEFYVPIGCLTDFKSSAKISMGLFFTWMPQVNSTVVLVPIGGAQWMIKKRLANFLIELPLRFRTGFEKQFSLSFKPFYEYWQDGPTTAVTTTGLPLGLPGNIYNFWGAELNFGYQF